MGAGEAGAGMRVAILGSGSAVPDPVRGNPSAAVVAGGEALLEIWSKILRDATSEYDGPVVLAEDAMELRLA
jgi:hypothetical protein